MSNCPGCSQPRLPGEPTFKGLSQDGRYYPPRCFLCLARLRHERAPSLDLAAYQRSRDREDFRREIVQPYDGGKINPEFIRAYPKESRGYFSDREIKQHGG